MPVTPEPLDDALRRKVGEVFGQPGPVVVPTGVPLPTDPLSALDWLKFITFYDILTAFKETAVIAPIGGLDPNQPGNEP